MFYRTSRAFMMVYEGDGTTGGDDTTSGGNADDKKFTQADLNRILAEDRRKNEQKNKQLISQLEELQRSKGLSDQERQDLANRIEELQNQSLTKEELAKKERDKLEKQYKSDTENLTHDRDSWKSRYERETIVRAITDASVEHESLNPRLIVSFLQPTSRLVETVGDDGKPNGVFSVKIKFDDTDKDGKPIVLDLSPTEAVKRMKEIPDQFGSLFKASATGGTGGNNVSGKGKTTTDQLKDTKTYAEWRKKNKSLDLSATGR